MIKPPRQSFWPIVIVFIVMKLLIHFLTGANYDLHRDEMLYWAFGDHLSFGYASNPPFIGFLSWIMHLICGHSVFCVKLLPALAGGVAILLVALMVKEFGGKLLAVIIACTAFLISPAYLRSNLLFQPVCFDELFWMLIIYLTLKLVNTHNPVYWLWIAAFAGIGFLNKYSVAFLIIGLALALIMSPHKILYRSRFLLHGILLGFVIILPNLIWQYLHNWPVVGHMKELQETQLVNVTLSGFIEGQVFMNFPAILVWLAGLLVLSFSGKERKFLFVPLIYFIVIVLLIIGKGKHYYSLGLYPVLFAAGGYILEKYLRGKLVYVNYVLIVVMVAIAGLILPFSLPLIQPDRMERFCKNAARFIGNGPTVWEDGLVHNIPQDYADMTGWKALADLAGKAYIQLDADEKVRCNVYAENYGQAGAIEFYGRKYNLPKPICFSDSYLLWAPDTIGDGPLIYINDEVGDIDELFGNYKEIGRIDDSYFRESGLQVYLCRNPKVHFREFYKEKVWELKGEYRR